MQTNLYKELFIRNWPIIPQEIQEKISDLKIAVAGCGSTGGGFVEGAYRLGVQNFHLSDNGEYELLNLNRQFVTQKEIGTNKAKAYEDKILQVNSGAQVRVWESGLNELNIDEFLNGVDFLFDAIDVTTESGMKMKLRLHEKAFEKKIPTGSALDLGYTQWLQSYNYHKSDQALHGKLALARQTKSPLKTLIVGFSPVEQLPLEITNEVIRLIENPNSGACQLACACFALAGMVTPYLLHFVRHNTLPPLTSLDLMEYFENEEEKAKRAELTQLSHIKLESMLLKIP